MNLEYGGISIAWESAMEVRYFQYTESEIRGIPHRWDRIMGVDGFRMARGQ